MKLFRCLLVISFCFIGLSCQEVLKEKKGTIKAQSYVPTKLPKDTTQLWVKDGNIESDTVLIICQGGPSENLTFIEKGRTSYRYIPNYSNYYVAYLHQAQTLNKKLLTYRGTFTVEMAKKEVDITSEMLFRALKYFKSKEKTVIVVGTSYGAYIIPNYLSTRPSLADKYVILAGRIDDNEQILEQHLKGFNGEFKEDGITYVPEDKKVDSSKYSEEEIKEYHIRQLLKGAIGEPRYSKELAKVDLTNTIYVYANNDKNVGKLSEEEVKFLKSKGAKVIETNTGHSETLYRFIDKLKNGSLKL